MDDLVAQAVWLDDEADLDEDDAWEAIDPGPVLGREQAARWLEKRGQRQEAARMRFTGSTQRSFGPWRARPRGAPHIPVRSPRRPQRRPREHRARRVARTCGARGDPDEPPPALAGSSHSGGGNA
jgi:hypothetical protein